MSKHNTSNPTWDETTEMSPAWEDTEPYQTPEEATGGGKSFGDLLQGAIYGAQPKEVGKQIVGVGENIAMMTTGIVSASFGTMSGAVMQGANELTEWYTGVDTGTATGTEFMKTFNSFTEAGTYRPVTLHGKYIEGLIAVPFEKMAEYGKDAGDYVMETTGDPALATAVRTAVEGSIYVLPYVGPKAINNIKARNEKRASNIIKQEKEIEFLKELESKKDLNRQQEKKLATRIAEDRKTSTHQGIRMPVESEKVPGTGIEILMTESDIIPFNDFLFSWKLANGVVGKKITKGKNKGTVKEPKLNKEQTASVKSQYADYLGRSQIAIEHQYQRARAEVQGNTVKPMSPDMTLPVGYISHLKSKVKAQDASARVRAEGRLSFKEYTTKEKKVIDEAMLRQEAEIQFQQEYNWKEEMAWSEKGLIDAEARTAFLIDRMTKRPASEPIDMAIQQYNSKSTGGIGKQRGAVDPSVFAEGLIKMGKNLDEFTLDMINQFGVHWKELSPTLYNNLASKSIPDKTMAVEQVISQKGGLVDTVLSVGKDYKGVMSKEHFSAGAPIPTFIETFGGQAITKLRRKAIDNPALTEIINSIERPETIKPGEIMNRDINAAYHIETGRYLSKIDSVIEPLGPQFMSGPRTIFRKIPKKVNDLLVDQLRSKEVLELSKETGVSKAAKVIRSVLDEIKKESDAVGLKEGYLEGYFPRMYDWKNIKNNKESFIKAIEPFVPKPEIREAIYDSIVEREGVVLPEANKGNRNSFLQEGSGPKVARNLELERNLDFIPDAILRPFLDNNVNSVLTKYIENSVGRIEAARRFGPNEEILYAKLREANYTGFKNGNPITPLEYHRLFDLIDASQKNWIKIKNPTARTASRAAVTAMNVLTLPLATFTSMPEMLIPLYKGGIVAYGKAVPQTFGTTVSNIGRAIYKGLPKTESQRFAESLLKASDLAATERVSALYNGEVNAINSVTFKANALHQFTKMTNILALDTWRNMTNGFLKSESKRTTIVNGKRVKKTRWWSKSEHERMRSEINRLGIDIQQGVDWVNRGMPKEGDSFYEGQYKTAAVNFAHESVMTSRPAIRPMWHSIPHLSPIAHLKGYTSMFGNVVMKRVYHDTLGEFRRGRMYTGTRNTAYMLGTGWLMLQMADLAFDIKDRISYGEKGNPKRAKETYPERLLRRADAAGFTGGASVLYSGFRARSTWGGNSAVAMLGPTVSMGSQFIDSLGTAMITGKTRPLASVLAKLTPLANVNKEIKKNYVDYLQKEVLDPWLSESLGNDKYIPKGPKE